jgi:hypothetical protein
VEDPEKAVVILDGCDRYGQEVSVDLTMNWIGLGVGKRGLRRDEAVQIACDRKRDIGPNDSQVPVSAPR